MGSRITEARRKAVKHWDKCVSTSISCPAAGCCNRSMGGPLTKSVVDTSWHLQIPSLCIHLLVCCLYLQFPKSLQINTVLIPKLNCYVAKRPLVAFTKNIQSHQHQSDHIKPPCNAKLPHGTMHICAFIFPYHFTSIPCFLCVLRWGWKTRLRRSLASQLENANGAFHYTLPLHSRTFKNMFEDIRIKMCINQIMYPWMQYWPEHCHINMFLPILAHAAQMHLEQNTYVCPIWLVHLMSCNQMQGKGWICIPVK